jgi:molybdopterin-binding protein
VSDTPTLSLAEHVCLALVQEGAGHGWAVGTLLAPDGEIGRIWSLSRPLTYRALEQLTDKELVRRKGESKPAGGRERQLLGITPRGRRVNDQWLAEPVEHLRDVRTELLLKLTLRQRAGLDVESLLEQQSAAFEPQIRALTTGPAAPDLVALWRRESARAVRRFLATALAGAPEEPVPTIPLLRLSARNQLAATISSIAAGEALTTVRATLPDGQHLTAVITQDAVHQLDLAVGDDIVVVVKSTEVMIAKPEISERRPQA